MPPAFINGHNPHKRNHTFRFKHSIDRRALRRHRFSTLEMLEARTLLSTYTVTSAADSGPGSLRDAIGSANADATADVIAFDIAGSGVQTIALASPLPAMTNSITLDGTTQPGYGGQPLIELNGAAASAGAATGTKVNGLEFDAANSIVKGLTIDRFSGDGVLLASGGSALIQADFIGTDPTGALAAGNGTGLVVNSSSNLITGNVISGNTADGIDITGDSNTFQGNFVGTDLTGKAALANGGFGVAVNNASNTTVGGTTAAARNIISGNLQDGVAFTNDSASGNLLEGNYIGLAADGVTALGNQGSGVSLGTFNGLSASNIIIAGNTIAGNAGEGIYLNNSSANLIAGNYVGTDSAGHARFDSLQNSLTANGGDGITLDKNAGGNTIGGAGSSQGNIISGNNGNGISVQTGTAATSNLVEGNLVGIDASGAADGNGGDGLFVVSGPVTIGSAGAGNVISSNFGYGVALAGGGAVVVGNFIGTDATGTQARGNAQDGVYITSSGNTVGGAAAGAGNVIAFNGTGGIGAGVDVFTGTGNAIRGNFIFSNATLGISLGTDATVDSANHITVTPVLNDSAGHNGPNNYQNFPVITSVSGTLSAVTISGTLNAAASTAFTLDFFVSPTSDPTGYGQGKTYLGSATVTTDATGAASFSITVSNVPAGQNAFSATATDAGNNTSEFAKDVAGTIASQSGTTTTLASSSDPSTLGQAVTFTATVAGGVVTPTGSITFSDGSTVLATIGLSSGSNVATFTTAALAVGSHTISASYGGDVNYTGSSSSLVQSVDRAPTTTSVSSSANPSTLGQAVTFTATVAAQVLGTMPTGTVTFMDGATPLGTVTLSGSGSAGLTTSALAVGDHSITAVYNSDGNFAGSNSQPLTQTVSSPPSSISGHTYFDVTGNGLSADDKPMGGVTVQLYDDTDGNGTLDGADQLVATAVSDNTTGSYSFANLAPGLYFVQEVTPSGYVRTAPTTVGYYTNSIATGISFTGDDFDNYQKCSCFNDICNVVFTIDGSTKVTNLRGHVHQGDTVSVTFTVKSGHTDLFSLVSYTAPGPSFSASNASQQNIYQDSSGVFGPGTYTLMVVVPQCYFQVDFVCGYAIDKFGPAGSNIFYSAQGRLISADNGGTTPPPGN